LDRKVEASTPGAARACEGVDQHQCRLDIKRLGLAFPEAARSKALMLNDRLSNTSKGGKNETVTSSVVLVRTHFYSVRMAGLVRRASDGNGKASTGKY